MSVKSSVNIIQEYGVKKGLVANYNFIEEQVGTHINVFGCIATLGNLRGEGKGASKKEAKKMSADRLIEQIPELSLHKNFDKILTVKNTPNLALDLSKLPSIQSNNYINSLAEWCIKKNVPSPEYVTEDIGSTHLPHFQTECKILSHSCKGSGDTKKASKHEAARLMYCLITDTSCKESDPNTDLEKFGIDIKQVEIDTYPEEKVHEEYKRLSTNFRFSKSNNLTKTIANCHNDLKECYNERERNVVCKMLQDLMSHTNAEGDRASVRKKFENILERLNVKVTYRDLSSLINRKKRQGNTYIASVEVSTKPNLIEIFCAETYTSAQHQAVINLSKTLLQILN